MLVEQLHSVTASFDKVRAVRYQQSLAKELRQHRKVPHSAVSSCHRGHAEVPLLNWHSFS